MNKRQQRLAQIVKILLHNSVGSQEELMELLERHNCSVTQATLSRDLKTLRTSKVATELGGYRYIIAANGTAADEMATHAMNTVRQAAILSVAVTGQTVVIKTRNGYAAGIAYDIDMSRCPEILGTIPGSDTVFAVLREDVTHEEAREVLSHFLPLDNHGHGHHH